MSGKRDFSIRRDGKLRVVHLREDFVGRLLCVHPMAARLFVDKLLESLRSLTGMAHILEPSQRRRIEEDLLVRTSSIVEAVEATIAMKWMSDGLRMLEFENEKFLEVLDFACKRMYQGEQIEAQTRLHT